MVDQRLGKKWTLFGIPYSVRRGSGSSSRSGGGGVGGCGRKGISGSSGLLPFLGIVGEVLALSDLEDRELDVECDQASEEPVSIDIVG